ncbi:MAG: response regulator [Verrucomicrobiae bacterium]|nr:response regulator [Verrucomicrobiae bacterium]MDW8344374.1 response regulator [Verrucomicrobiae bacterium]
MQTISTQPVNQPQPAQAARYSVLVIDDDEDFCKIVRQMLEPSGYEVITVNNPVKALELYTRDKDKIDLIILDFYMPGLDGGKTFEWLRKLNDKVKVILCSGADELRLRQLMVQYALDGYIHKPFRVQEALYAIQRVLAIKR